MNFLFGSGLKSLRKKSFFFADFALQNMVETMLPPSYGIGATIGIGQEMLCLPYKGFVYKYLLSINPFIKFIKNQTQAESENQERLKKNLSKWLWYTNF